jgi:hypothetical protein
MTRNLKALGLALVAVFAFSAVAVSAAQAAEFHAEEKSVVVTGTQDEKAGAQKVAILEIEGGLKVECANTFVEGTQTGTETGAGKFTAKESTVRPEYWGEGVKGTKCNSFLGAKSVEVKTNMCHYRLPAETTVEQHALVDVICGKGEAIEIIGGGITLKITGGPENLVGGVQVNKGLTGVNYANEGGPTTTRDITVKSTVEGIHYTCAPAFTCGLLGVGTTGNKAKYVGDVTAKGFKDLNATAETTKYEDGAQVGIWWE